MGKVTWCGYALPREQARHVKRETSSVIADMVFDQSGGSGPLSWNVTCMAELEDCNAERIRVTAREGNSATYLVQWNFIAQDG